MRALLKGALTGRAMLFCTAENVFVICEKCSVGLRKLLKISHLMRASFEQTFGKSFRNECSSKNIF